MKKLKKKSGIFCISAQNINCGTHWRRLWRVPTIFVFWTEIRKIMHTSVTPSFTIYFPRLLCIFACLLLSLQCLYRLDFYCWTITRKSSAAENITRLSDLALLGHSFKEHVCTILLPWLKVMSDKAKNTCTCIILSDNFGWQLLTFYPACNKLVLTSIWEIKWENIL